MVGSSANQSLVLNTHPGSLSQKIPPYASSRKKSGKKARLAGSQQVRGCPVFRCKPRTSERLLGAPGATFELGSHPEQPSHVRPADTQEMNSSPVPDSKSRKTLPLLGKRHRVTQSTVERARPMEKQAVREVGQGVHRDNAAKSKCLLLRGHKCGGTFVRSSSDQHRVQGAVFLLPDSVRIKVQQLNHPLVSNKIKFLISTWHGHQWLKP